MRLVELRLLDGPNVYRLEPTVKLEVVIGRRRTWYGQRDPGRHARVRLGATIPAGDQPIEVAALIAWVRRLRTEHMEGAAGVAAHRSSDPGHWIVSWPWTSADRARAIAEAALALASRDVSPSRRARLTGGQERGLARWSARIAAAPDRAPAWIRDADRTIPVISISGTNGKSTTTRLVSHILTTAGLRVGTTTSDGVLVDGRMLDPGDWTGPAGAAQILTRSDVDVAVLETARGGIVLKGLGYESNEASILTNVSSDHLDLQGIHTLPELAEVKATVCRVTKADGWVILNADDPHVAGVARSVRAHVAFFSMAPRSPGVLRRAVAAGGRGYVVRDGWFVAHESARTHRIIEVADVPSTLAGLARHNVANALAAIAGARALGATIEQVRDGLRDFRPSTDRSPGRLNLFRLGSRIVIVDFAHNEAGVAAVLDVAEGIAGGSAGRTTPITMIVGTAGDRPDDTIRGIGRIAAQRAQRVAIKETLDYLRGRTRESMIGELRAGIRSGGGHLAEVPIYETETAALRAELNGAGTGSSGGRPEAPRIIVLMCHAERERVFELLEGLGARAVDGPDEITRLIPRLHGRDRR